MSIANLKPGSSAPVTIDLMINGERRSSVAVTLAELLAEAGYGDAKVATAHNGDFVPERNRASTLLAAGDSIEIVSPRQGG